MAVFDVDHGVTQASVDACDASFGDAWRVWYPSFQHTPETPRYRLIVPFASQLPAASWARVRAAMLSRHHIPADPKTSNSISHCYYVPSGPVPLRVAGDDAKHYEVPTWDTNVPTAMPKLPSDWTPRERGVGYEEMKLLVERRIKTLQKKGDPRAVVLEAVLAGRPISEHGSRDVETTRAAALLVYALPDAGLEDIVELMEPSLQAMQAEGSKLQLHHIEQKVKSAMYKRAQAEEHRAAIFKAFDEAK